MGLRDRLIGVLARGEAPEADPNEMVDIGNVPLTMAPMAVAELENAGFHAVFIESFNVATSVRSDARIMVPRGESASASEILDDLS